MTSKIYFLRHTAEGVVWDFPFSSPPGDEQKAAVAERCAQRHGTHHKKGFAYELTVVEATLLGDHDVPDVSPFVPSEGVGLSQVSVDGAGTVSERP